MITHNVMTANYLFHLHIKALVEKEYAQSKCTYVQFTQYNKPHKTNSVLPTLNNGMKTTHLFPTYTGYGKTFMKKNDVSSIEFELRKSDLKPSPWVQKKRTPG